MGVLDSIVLIEALGLALLAIFLIVVARRRSAARRDAAQDAGTVGLVGGATMTHGRHEGRRPAYPPGQSLDS